MESNKDTNKPNQEKGMPSTTGQKQKVSTPHTEKANLTSYSFVRSPEDAETSNSPSSPQIPSGKHQPKYTQMPLQMMQVPAGQYPQNFPGMIPNYMNPSPVYPPGMFGGVGPKPILTSPSPTDPRIAFQDIPYQEASAGNTPQSQIDPSPTAENLIPGILRDEIDNKTYTFPGKVQDKVDSNGNFFTKFAIFSIN